MMKNTKNIQSLIAASGVALAALFWLQPESAQIQKNESASVERVVSIQTQAQPVRLEKKKETVLEIKGQKLVLRTEAPAPYFLNSDNFKTYDSLLYKVVRSAAEKDQFNLSLLDRRSLDDAADYLKNPSPRPGKEEKIYHLKANGFLIKAITAHPFEFEVTSAIKEILAINLSDAKSQLSPESYAMLKENKAELLYHALAVSEAIQQSYSAAPEDSESQILFKKVQDLHIANVVQSKKMIADR